jgi:hypothetical protein
LIASTAAPWLIEVGQDHMYSKPLYTEYGPDPGHGPAVIFIVCLVFSPCASLRPHCALLAWQPATVLCSVRCANVVAAFSLRLHVGPLLLWFHMSLCHSVTLVSFVCCYRQRRKIRTNPSDSTAPLEPRALSPLCLSHKLSLFFLSSPPPA